MKRSWPGLSILIILVLMFHAVRPVSVNAQEAATNTPVYTVEPPPTEAATEAPATEAATEAPTTEVIEGTPSQEATVPVDPSATTEIQSTSTLIVPLPTQTATMIPSDIPQETPTLINGHKVLACHLPPGNPSNGHVIEIDEHAWNDRTDPHGHYEGGHGGDFLITGSGQHHGKKCWKVAPTATSAPPTWTPNPTLASSSTPTALPTDTAIATQPTFTPTATSTTGIPTASFTAQASPTGTLPSTETPTATATGTGLPTDTPTITPTASLTPTPTFTSTPGTLTPGFTIHKEACGSFYVENSGDVAAQVEAIYPDGRTDRAYLEPGERSPTWSALSTAPQIQVQIRFYRDDGDYQFELTDSLTLDICPTATPLPTCDLKGDAFVRGGKGFVTFTNDGSIACDGTAASYQRTYYPENWPQDLYDSDSATIQPGETVTLQVKLACYYQIDAYRGGEPAPDPLYQGGDDGRVIDGHMGELDCSTPVPPTETGIPTITPTATATQATPTETLTSTPTYTPSPTPTNTPPATFTPTSTPTDAPETPVTTTGSIGSGLLGCEDFERTLGTGDADNKDGFSQLIRRTVVRDNNLPIDFVNPINLSRLLDDGHNAGGSFEPVCSGRVSFSHNQHLYVVNNDGSDPKSVLFNEAQIPAIFTSWSKNGTIAFTDITVKFTDADGTFLTDTGVEVYNLNWSPDGTVLAISDMEKHLHFLGEDGAIRFSARTDFTCTNPNWAADQTYLNCDGGKYYWSTDSFEPTKSYLIEAKDDPANTDMSIVVNTIDRSYLVNAESFTGFKFIGGGGTGDFSPSYYETQPDWYVPAEMQTETVEITFPTITSKGPTVIAMTGGDSVDVDMPITESASSCPNTYTEGNASMTASEFFAANGMSISLEFRQTVGATCGIDTVGTADGNGQLVSALVAASSD